MEMILKKVHHGIVAQFIDAQSIESTPPIIHPNMHQVLDPQEHVLKLRSSQPLWVNMVIASIYSWVPSFQMFTPIDILFQKRMKLKKSSTP